MQLLNVDDRTDYVCKMCVCDCACVRLCVCALQLRHGVGEFGVIVYIVGAREREREREHTRRSDVWLVVGCLSASTGLDECALCMC